MQEKQGQGSQGDMDKKSQDQTGTQGGQGDLDKKSDQGDFGKPGNYFARQVDRWTKQYRASETEHIPEVEKLVEYLTQN